MKAHYDPEADALAVSWGGTVEESDELEPGVILDYDSEGNIIGIEILNASINIKNLAKLPITKVAS